MDTPLSSCLEVATRTGMGRNFSTRWVVLLALTLTACNREEAPQADLVVTLAPLKMILEPVVGDRKSVATLVPPGASPHTFALTPSRARMLAEAEVVFYVDDAMDGWAARGDSGTRHRFMDWVPREQRLTYESEHIHSDDGAHHDSAGDENGHFWSDPVVVAAVVPSLVAALSTLDPDGQSVYEANGAAFVESLHQLDGELRASAEGMPDASLVAFHPSWDYFFHRYGMKVAAYVEPIPGKEPTPQTIVQMQDALRDGPPVLVLSEVQLSRKPAEVLAEALGAGVGVLDPLGGTPSLTDYGALLRHNLGAIKRALP